MLKKTLDYDVTCDDCEHFQRMAGGGPNGFCSMMQEALRHMGMPAILPQVPGNLSAGNCDCFEPTEDCLKWMQDADEEAEAIEQTNREISRDLNRGIARELARWRS